MILLIVAAVCCTLAAFWGPGRPAGSPWYGNFHIGWLGVAFYLWSIVLAGHLR